MKRYIIIIITIFSLLLNNSKVTTVFADESNYALIQTQYDQENNDSFGSAIKLSSNKKITNISSYYGNTGGIIENNDVDNYTLDVFCDSRLTIRLNAVDSVYANILNYNFKIYKQKNIQNPSVSNVELIYTSTESGCNDYFTSIVSPGTYFVRIYGVNNSYDNRNSYLLDYSVTIETKNTYDLNYYTSTYPNSYLIWENDFQIFDDSSNVFKDELIVSNIPTLSHSLLEKYKELNGLLSYEVYFWGLDLRNSLVTEIENMLSKLAVIIQDLKQQEAYVDLTVEIISGFFKIVFSSDEFVQDLFEGLLDSASFLLGNMLPINQKITYDFLTEYLWDLKQSLATGYGTSESEVIVISKYSYLKNKNAAILTGNQFCTNGLSSNVNYNKYQSNIIYEKKQFQIDIVSGTWINVYGKIKQPNAQSDIFDILL